MTRKGRRAAPEGSGVGAAVGSEAELPVDERQHVLVPDVVQTGRAAGGGGPFADPPGQEGLEPYRRLRPSEPVGAVWG